MVDKTPNPKLVGGATVTFKHGEPTKVELTVRHLVDDWYRTTFRFKVKDGVARLRKADPEGGGYHFHQNAPARKKAYGAVHQLPCIEKVERLHD